jgi:hydrogenase expression/formation protein HypC
MCLAIPGKILETEKIGGLRIGRIQFGGVTRKAYLDYVPEAAVGDYVMVHVGFAISKVDQEEAARTYHMMQQMGLLEEELGATQADNAPLPADGGAT